LLGEVAEGASPLRRVTTVQHATLEWLREQIATGAVEPGSQLRQEVLARSVGVSLSAVREALQTLEAEGQVVYAPRRGYFVADLSVAELVEAYRIRDLLETEAIARGVGALGDDDIEGMRAAIKEMAAAHRRGDLRALTDANRRFHFTIFDAAGMPRMAQMIRVLWESTDRYRSIYFGSPQHRRAVDAEHKEIMAAVAARQTDVTIRLLREHRDHALDALCKALPTSKGASVPVAEARRRQAGSA
jgi:DNA-binding GntR family transcriptional regulator